MAPAPRHVARCSKALGADDGLTRYVGGAVRDELLGLPVSDIDLATRLRPDEVVERLEAAGIKAVPTGIEHGTVTAVSDGQPVEVTTLRRDVSTDGRRATVAFTDDWQEDAARRDFTINALYADPADGEIFDYFGGLDDLEARRVRFIGDPLERIAEDHLRILRFFRFHARFGTGEPDPAALDACTARANDLMALSRERIADELLKLLGHARPGADRRADARPRHPSAGAARRSSPPRSPRCNALIAAEREAERRARPAAAACRRCCRPTRCWPRRSPPGSGCRTRRASASPAPPTATSAPTRRRSPIGSAPNARSTGCCSPASRPTPRRSPAGRSPRLPIGGGKLIARGVPEGPAVARTLRRIEDRWVEAGFPPGDAFERIVAEALAADRVR